MEALFVLGWIVGCVYLLDRLMAWQPEIPKKMRWAWRQAEIELRREPRVPMHDAVGIGIALGWVAFLLALVLT